MKWEECERIVAMTTRPAGFLTSVVFALVLLTSFGLRAWLKNSTLEQKDALAAWRTIEPQSAALLKNLTELRNLKSTDLENFKQGLTELASSKKSLYESGLNLQEEKRLLEKQWEIISTVLKLDEEAQRLILRREDQPLESYPLHFGIAQGFGEPLRPLPDVVRITSKERFAHPERGKAETVNGELVWTPPQVGTSVRANALGEYVIFTDSDLVLHGPPTIPEEHEKYPHVCLGLPLTTARSVYRKSYIGTKIILHE